MFVQVQMDSLRLSAAKSSPLMETITMVGSRRFSSVLCSAGGIMFAGCPSVRVMILLL